MNCGDCKFFDRRLSTSEGTCRRYPPQMVAEESYDSWDVGSYWPTVETYKMWCGEWKSKES